jgi:hypothetical protein
MVALGTPISMARSESRALEKRGQARAFNIVQYVARTGMLRPAIENSRRKKPKSNSMLCPTGAPPRTAPGFLPLALATVVVGVALGQCVHVPPWREGHSCDPD